MREAVLWARKATAASAPRFAEGVSWGQLPGLIAECSIEEFLISLAKNGATAERPDPKLITVGELLVALGYMDEAGEWL